MPAESKKFLWIAISVGVFVLVALAAVLFLFAPPKSGDALLDVGAQAVPKAEDPQDFLATGSQTTVAPDTERSGDIIIVYGDKPDLGSGAASQSSTPNTPAQAPAAQTSTTTPRSATPAATTVHVAPPATTATTVRPAPATTTTVRVAAPPAAKPVAAPAATATTVVKSAAVSVWIQAGSFQSRASADSLLAAFTTRGVTGKITVKDIDGKSYYQVKAGPYPSRDEAKKWLPTVRAVPGASEGAFITN